MSVMWVMEYMYMCPTSFAPSLPFFSPLSVFLSFSPFLPLLPPPSFLPLLPSISLLYFLSFSTFLTLLFSYQTLYSSIDDLKDTKADKDLLEVEVREVSQSNTSNESILPSSGLSCVISCLLMFPHNLRTHTYVASFTWNLHPCTYCANIYM